MNTAILFGGIFLLTPAVSLSPASAAGPSGGSSTSKSTAVTLEPMAGSPAKRVILTQKAAERLGIETGKVGEQPIVRKQIVGGLITPPAARPTEPRPGGVFADVTQPSAAPAPARVSGGGFGGFGGFARAAPSSQTQLASAVPAVAQGTAKDAPSAAAPAAAPVLKEAWVMVTLSPGEWERLAKDKPARVMPLATRDKPANEIIAKPAGLEPQEDSKRSMLKVYYVVPGKEHGLELNKRMRVELELAGGGEKHKVVPYSALYYDAKGAPWVYVVTQPLTYERQRVTVERIVGDIAVLSNGPEVGTTVVVTGAPMLYGAEVFGK